MHEMHDLIACEQCDALHRRLSLAHREIAKCIRCEAELDRNSLSRHQRLLPLTLASLILFIIANVFPIVEIELQGIHNQTTLTGAVIALAREGTSPVALLVLATTILFPLVQLMILFYILANQQQRLPTTGFSMLVRVLQMLRPWGMIEVFMLGVLVALIKLSSMAIIVPGVALWAFSVLTVLLTLVVSFNPRYFWQLESGRWPRSHHAESTQPIKLAQD